LKEIQTLLNLLKPEYRDLVSPDAEDRLVEIVIDFGRPLEFRYLDRSEIYEDTIIGQDDLDTVENGVGGWGPDNRTGLDHTLHRVSRIDDRKGKPVGYTLRVGRAIEGSDKLVEDLVNSGLSILFVGKPGAGKTTILRGCAKRLSTDQKRRVVIVDTSDEIAGCGRIPHPAVGRARKMSVPQGKSQHELLLQAVENHYPEVLIVDEISDDREVASIRTISRRGVQVLATAHGQELDDVMANPPLANLLGGIKPVTLTDEAAKKRGTSKTVLERQGEPAFDAIVEIVGFDFVKIYTGLARVVDSKLRGAQVMPEEREIREGKVLVRRGQRIGPVSDKKENAYEEGR
jgi:stage III sporulation protein SpoIIIAA